METRVSNLVQRLRAWGLNGLAASLLESAGPLAFLGAQALYVAGPALDPLAPPDDVAALAQLLENPDALQELASLLDEEPPA